MVPKRTKHCHPGQILRRQNLPRPSTTHRGVPKRLLRTLFRTDTLANHLAVLKHDDPARITFLEDLHNTDVLVLDDFLTTPIDAATAHQLLNILAEREPRGSTIVTSQFTPDEWYKSIPDAVIAESILNRLVAGAEIITLEGTNMRLTQ